MARISETARQTARKAEKGGIIIVQANWAEMLDSYYIVHQENYRRTGVMPHPKSYFSGIAHEMAEAGYSVLWAALDREGHAIAFHNDMHFGVGAWYHTGCSTDAALKNGANYLLFWKSMLGAKAAGRRWYDCGEIFPVSADKKRDGLTLFKTRFGGEPHRFLKATKQYDALSRRRIVRRSFGIGDFWEEHESVAQGSSKLEAHRMSPDIGIGAAPQSARPAFAVLRCLHCGRDDVLDMKGEVATLSRLLGNLSVC